MKRTIAAFALASIAGLVLAQGPGPGAGYGPGSTSGGGQGGGPGKGAGKGGDWSFGASNTRGWSLMTAEERTQHRNQMLAVKTEAECKTVQDEHRKAMEARAKEKGAAIPAAPRNDMCARMKQRGRIQ